MKYKNEKPKKFWTKERCIEEGLKHKHKKDFALKSKGAFMAARRNRWLEEIWLKMEPLGNRYKRCLYAYEFPDKSVYIGLTYNIKSRNTNHNRFGTVFNYKVLTNLMPEFKQLTDYIDRIEASKLEGIKLEEYKAEGWKILNKKKTGELGGNTVLWTKEHCLEKSVQCKTRNEFRLNFNGAYSASRRNGWFQEITAHMKNIIKPKNYWTKIRCKNKAVKCKTKMEFRRHSEGAYIKAQKSGWLTEICSHMKKL